MKKSYPFTKTGLEQLLKDERKRRGNRNIEIVYWSFIGVLCLSGFIKEYATIKLIACAITSKSVKYLVHS